MSSRKKTRGSNPSEFDCTPDKELPSVIMRFLWALSRGITSKSAGTPTRLIDIPLPIGRSPSTSPVASWLVTSGGLSQS
jgi:hypothetical protein